MNYLRSVSLVGPLQAYRSGSGEGYSLRSRVMRFFSLLDYGLFEVVRPWGVTIFQGSRHANSCQSNGETSSRLVSPTGVSGVLVFVFVFLRTLYACALVLRDLGLFIVLLSRFLCATSLVVFVVAGGNIVFTLLH